VLNRRSGRSSYKVVLLGDPMVGKTSLRKKYLGQTMTQQYMMTLGAEFSIKRLENDVIQIWDLAGQPGFSQVRKGYYMGAQGALLVFDLTRRQSFKNLHNWIQEILKNKGEPLPIILVGNKADLKGTTADDLSAEEIDRFRGDLEDWSGYDVAYMEASALTGLNVEDIFENIVESINMHISMSQGS
jgi:small GTP-binding protein